MVGDHATPPRGRAIGDEETRRQAARYAQHGRLLALAAVALLLAAYIGASSGNGGNQLTDVAFVFGLGALAFAVPVWVRAYRARRVLDRSEWRPYRFRYIAQPRSARLGLNPGAELTRLDSTDAAPLIVQLGPTNSRRSDRLQATTTVWAATDGSRDVVIALPRTRELFATRTPPASVAKAYVRGAEEVHVEEALDDAAAAQVQDRGFRSARLLILTSVGYYPIIAVALVTQAGLSVGAGVAISLAGTAITLLLVRTITSSHRDRLARYVDPVSGETAIPGEHLPVPRAMLVRVALTLCGCAAVALYLALA